MEKFDDYKWLMSDEGAEDPSAEVDSEDGEDDEEDEDEDEGDEPEDPSDEVTEPGNTKSTL